MTGITAHICSLINDSSDGPSVSDQLRKDIDQWFSLDNGSLASQVPVGERSEDVDLPGCSILDVYLSNDIHKNEENNQVISRLQSDPNHETLIPAILSLLSSQDANDVISEPMAELVGFENLDLVMELLEKRETCEQTISRYLTSRSLIPPAPAPDALLSGIQLDSEPPDLSAEAARQRMDKAFQENANKPLFSGTAYESPEVLPHVYSSSSMSQNNVLSATGHKYLLPLGTERKYHEEYEEVIVPPARPVPVKSTERLIPVSELDSLAKGCFAGYTSLNRIQSIVYPTAYGSNENMLICAPTGAGKTDVAMLTILRVIDQHRSRALPEAELRATIDRDAFKIIYVAPMKALAAEIVRKLGKRLRWLSIEVRELTGDMQMSKAEIAATQIIVTTPEKWDVVTRKPTGEGELASSLKLLVIDEVHLLNDERGAVIETIVARTLRQVESSQSVIRIVGLSATLPNFIDVAEFLSVSKYKGLFYFDSSFRPVPLEQHFLGIKGKPGSALSRKNLDQVTFGKVSDLVVQGHQVMVFVHARKETVKAAIDLKEASIAKGSADNFSCQDHPQWALFRREISQSRNKEMKLLFDHGFGIHHAGMLRSDRNLMERLFEARAIKVLCCTATLAWGVNLPAHAVVIKGTQVFGRAGRPGLETSGEGYICTTEDKLTHYLEVVTSQNPIESQFRKGLIDALNAEVALGTVANLRDAVQWLGYTYLQVRMRRNPFVYGISREDLLDDPQLGGKRQELINLTINQLVEAKMVVKDHRSDSFTPTELGRIAAKYYLRHASVEIFNKEFRPRMSEADVLAMLSMSTEFDQIQLRDSEIKELEQLLEHTPCELKRKFNVDTDEEKGISTSQEKVNILLQAYISREVIDDFALVSDMAYVAQNGGRIIRALLEIALSRKWANAAMVLIGMSKAIEKRLWPYEHPLQQFDLRTETLYKVQEWADEWTIKELLTLDAVSLGQLIHMNELQGEAVIKAAKHFPSLQVEYDLRPLGHDVLNVSVRLTPNFTWNARLHGSSEPFWIWVEDYEGITILQLAHIIIRPSTEITKLDFVIIIPNGIRPPFLTIWVIGDRWIGAEDSIQISLEALIMPTPSQSHTSLLSLPLLSTSVVKQPVLQASLTESISTFDAVQTQAYWTLINTHYHALLCAPSGNGKSTMAKILALTATEQKHDFWSLIVTPHQSGAHEMYADLKQLCPLLDIPLELVSSQNALSHPRGRLIRVIASAALAASLTSFGPYKTVAGLNLVICDDLEQLDSTYEWAISLLRHATQSQPTRYIGFSDSLNDPADLADWLNVHPVALISFRPRDRDQVLNFSTHTFTIPHSASLFKAMAKPAHAAIRTAPPGETAIAFVSSRGMCRLTALNLLTQCMLEMESTRGYLPENVSNNYIEDVCTRLQDTSLVDYVSKGVGFFHGGIKKQDRLTMLGLFAEGIIRVLIVPHDSVASLPVRAAVVVVMGTQYVSVGETASKSGDRQVHDYSLSKIVRMQSRAVRHSGAGHFFLFCQAEAKDTLTRFLNEGLPLESELLEGSVVVDWMKAQKVDWRQKKQDLVDALSFSFFARRVVTNPSYYDCSTQARNESLSRIVDGLIEQVPDEL
ncbi:Putative helicase mug81 [Leucoagaricus sp. SymC.cos]|nr:Putative helicase mug81 [Leucoagaricus sp. SymC.cos]